MSDLFKDAIEKELAKHVGEENVLFVPMEKLDHKRIGYQETTINGFKI